MAPLTVYIIRLLILLLLFKKENLPGGKHLKNKNKNKLLKKRVSTLLHLGQNTQRNVLSCEKISSAITDIRIRKTEGNLLWNYYRGCVRKTTPCKTSPVRIGL